MWARDSGRPSGNPAACRTCVDSPWGSTYVTWRIVDGLQKVWYIELPTPGAQADDVAKGLAEPGELTQAARQVQAALERMVQGSQETVALEAVAMERCSTFQDLVLRAEYAVPRGQVTTYGRLARHIGRPRASRAVGRALATNPFALIVPCHRAIRSDGSLGGFQGGLEMKRALLAYEGVRCTSDCRVVEPVYRY